MSFYATMTGQIQYPSQAAFDKVIENLTKGGWVNSEGYFLDEMNCPISESVITDIASKPDIDFDKKIINVPMYHHRNLARVAFF